MKATIVFAHPWHGSFNKVIMDRVVKEYERKNKPYQIIDLNKDGFNPVLEEHDLALFSKGKTTDPLVKKYQQMLHESNEVVFIFPVWWYDVPAIIKGFIDKVMLKNFSYRFTSSGMQGLLTNIKKTTVITTSEWPAFYLRLRGGNVIKGVFINKSLKKNGFRNIRWVNCGLTTSSSEQRRVRFLNRISSIFSK